MKQVNQVGVDVDSEKLVCAMQCAGHRMPLATFANTAAGHTKFMRGRPTARTRRSYDRKLCMT
jgi:hypothetical protein